MLVSIEIYSHSLALVTGKAHSSNTRAFCHFCRELAAQPNVPVSTPVRLRG